MFPTDPAAPEKERLIQADAVRVDRFTECHHDLGFNFNAGGSILGRDEHNAGSPEMRTRREARGVLIQFPFGRRDLIERPAGRVMQPRRDVERIGRAQLEVLLGPPEDRIAHPNRRPQSGDDHARRPTHIAGAVGERVGIDRPVERNLEQEVVRIQIRRAGRRIHREDLQRPVGVRAPLRTEALEPDRLRIAVKGACERIDEGRVDQNAIGQVVVDRLRRGSQIHDPRILSVAHRRIGDRHLRAQLAPDDMTAVGVEGGEWQGPIEGELHPHRLGDNGRITCGGRDVQERGQIHPLRRLEQEALAIDASPCPEARGDAEIEAVRGGDEQLDMGPRQRIGRVGEILELPTRAILGMPGERVARGARNRRPVQVERECAVGWVCEQWGRLRQRHRNRLRGDLPARQANAAEGAVGQNAAALGPREQIGTAPPRIGADAVVIPGGERKGGGGKVPRDRIDRDRLGDGEHGARVNLNLN